MSYLDAARWDQATKRIVCRRSIGHDRLRERAGKTLSGMGVRIILDASLWARLASPAPAMQEAA